MNWLTAEQYAEQGYAIRRKVWDGDATPLRWWKFIQGFWWQFSSAGQSIVHSTDYAVADLRADDWTLYPPLAEGQELDLECLPVIPNQPALGSVEPGAIDLSNPNACPKAGDVIIPSPSGGGDASSGGAFDDRPEPPAAPALTITAQNQAEGCVDLNYVLGSEYIETIDIEISMASDTMTLPGDKWDLILDFGTTPFGTAGITHEVLTLKIEPGGSPVVLELEVARVGGPNSFFGSSVLMATAVQPGTMRVSQKAVYLPLLPICGGGGGGIYD